MIQKIPVNVLGCIFIQLVILGWHMNCSQRSKLEDLVMFTIEVCLLLLAFLCGLKRLHISSGDNGQII